jgi:hypothetical protein
VFALDSPVPRIVLDFPHGGCRLEVFSDGQTSISYGAMPRWISVKPNLFSFDDLTSSLKAREGVPEASAVRSSASGSFQLPESSGRVLSIMDEAFVRKLLNRAWKARVPAKSLQEIEDYRWLAKACAFY